MQWQPGDVCIGPIGDRFFLIRIDSKTYDGETFSIETAQSYPIPEDLTKPGLNQYLNWYPLAYDDQTQVKLEQIAEEQDWPIAALPTKLIVATALRLTRTFAF